MTKPSIHPIESASIVTERQHSVEMRKPPALPSLSDAELTRARELSSTLIRPEDQLDDIVTFGSEAQAALARIAKSTLDGVRVNALDEVLELSDGVMSQIQTLNLAIFRPATRRYLWFLRESAAAIQHRVEKFFSGYKLVNARLEREEANIQEKEAAARQRYYFDIELEKATLDAVRDAKIRLAAIVLFLQGDYGYVELERRQQILAQEKEAAARENRHVDFTVIAAVERYARYLDNLEQKAAALWRVLFSSQATGITIHKMASNEILIRQTLSDIRLELLPQWYTLVAIAYQAYQQRGVAEFVRAVDEADAKLLHAVGDQIEQGAFDTADLMTRPARAVAAMEYFNHKLIKSLEILKTASEEAREIRAEAEAKSQQLIADLSDAAANMAMREN